MAMTYLVTGGAGFIGSHLTDALVSSGDRVIILDDLSTGRRANIADALATGAVQFVEGSVLDPRIVDQCMAACDACIHLAAAVGVRRILDRPVEGLCTNVLGAYTVMASAALHERRLLFASSSEVYGKVNQANLGEDSDHVIGSPAKSRWSYAIAKEFGETLAHAYVNDLGAEMIVVRLFNTVGPRQASMYGMVLPRFVRQALAGERLTVYGDGTQTRCFTDVSDVVDALRGLIKCDAVGVTLNIGSQAPTSVLDLAELVIERTGSSSEIIFVPYQKALPDGFEELGNRAPDTSAVRALTGWTPQRTLERTIDAVVAYEREATLAPIREAAVMAPSASVPGDLLAA